MVILKIYDTNPKYITYVIVERALICCVQTAKQTRRIFSKEARHPGRCAVYCCLSVPAISCAIVLGYLGTLWSLTSLTFSHLSSIWGKSWIASIPFFLIQSFDFLSLFLTHLLPRSPTAIQFSSLCNLWSASTHIPSAPQVRGLNHGRRWSRRAKLTTPAEALASSHSSE